MTTMKNKDKGTEFEELITVIHKKIDKDADVQMDQRIKGVNSKIDRQVDVLLTTRLCLYPLKVAIECKNLKRRVDVGVVDGFIGKLKDIEANKGILISKSGFTKGAINLAKENQIALLGYRQAVEVDWNRFTANESWIKIYHIETDLPSLNVTVVYESVTPNEMQNIHERDFRLFDRKGKEVGTFRDIRKTLIAEGKRYIGKFWVEAEPETDIYIETQGKPRKVVSFSCTGVNTAYLYTVNLFLEKGQMLETPGDGTVFYEEMETKPIDMEVLLRDQRPYVIKTQEEMDKMLGGLQTRHLPYDEKKWRFLKMTMRNTKAIL